MTLTLTPAARARFTAWLQDVGSAELRADVVESEMLQVMEDRAESGESMSYELGRQYTTTGQPELFYADAKDFDDDKRDQVNWIVSEYLGSECTKQDAELVIAFALAIYQEQLDLGLGDADEFATRANVMDWLHARTYDWTRLYEAATGDVGAIVEVRTEAGVPVL